LARHGIPANGSGWVASAFRLHSVAVLGIVMTLFTMLFNHWFEYDYVWKHSNLQMPLKYIASCFWEGQEGSFLLWTFWHMVLGNVLIWRCPRAVVLGMGSPGDDGDLQVQVFLAVMLLGIYVGDVRVGSSPFLLIRELPENIGLPWTAMANYLSAIPQFADGRGLNPLLQNYWMVIHPPTLFLGICGHLDALSHLRSQDSGAVTSAAGSHLPCRGPISGS
jgi:cytochrome c-type biogenesis protein CcmF